MNIRSTIAATFLCLFFAMPSFGRILDAELGRWLTRDPLWYLDGMGLYNYVQNQPQRLDPFGLSSRPCSLGGCTSAVASQPPIESPPWALCVIENATYAGCVCCCDQRGGGPICYLGCSLLRPVPYPPPPPPVLAPAPGPGTRQFLYNGPCGIHYVSYPLLDCDPYCDPLSPTYDARCCLSCASCNDAMSDYLATLAARYAAAAKSCCIVRPDASPRYVWDSLCWQHVIDEINSAMAIYRSHVCNLCNGNQ
jgi:hypothetical protein